MLSERQEQWNLLNNMKIGGVLTQEELIKKVAERSQITQDQALNVINALTEQIKEQLASGEKVTITGFGTFILSQRKAKTFVNPKTGEKVELPERSLPHFKAGGDFKRTIREKK